MKATWNGTVIAESDATVIIEDNHYFPPGSIRSEYFHASSTTSRCYWKGAASYADIIVDSEVNADAAWTYKHPSEAAAAIAGYWAFWKGVEVS